MDEPEDHVEENGVEVDTKDNCSAHLKELTPKLVLVRLPETCIATLNNAARWKVKVKVKVKSK